MLHVCAAHIGDLKTDSATARAIADWRIQGMMGGGGGNAPGQAPVAAGGGCSPPLQLATSDSLYEF